MEQKMSKTITKGNIRTIKLCGSNCLRENTKINESRYNAKGITHNSGIAAISVVMCVVTASIQLEGTKANTTQEQRPNKLTDFNFSCWFTFPIGSIGDGLSWET